MDEKQEFKKVGIALDSYKVKRFRSVLSLKGFKVKLGKGATKDTAMLYINGVTLENLPEVQKILNQLQHEFAHRN